jgi:serine/threonine-protein kinase
MVAQHAKYGAFEVMRRLAVGGMGEIFLARQTGIKGFERLAIIKTLLMDAQEDEERVEMFLAEARIAALLNHPCIVQIFDLGEEAGTYYIAMEYVEGDTVGRLLTASLKQGRHTPWPFVALMAQTARALHYAHHHTDPLGRPLQLVHRDISPQNIMVRRDGTPKVVDFGIAKVANDSAVRTRTGVVKGKLAYMAPEQVRGDVMDGRTDLYALGLVTWELTVGRRMFPNLPDHELFRRMGDCDIPRPSEVDANFPPALEAVITRALAPVPEERYQTGNDLAVALEAVLAQVPAGDKPDVPAYVDSLIGAAVQERVMGAALSSPGFRRNTQQSVASTAGRAGQGHPEAPATSSRGSTGAGPSATRHPTPPTVSFTPSAGSELPVISESVTVQSVISGPGGFAPSPPGKSRNGLILGAAVAAALLAAGGTWLAMRPGAPGPVTADPGGATAPGGARDPGGAAGAVSGTAGGAPAPSSAGVAVAPSSAGAGESAGEPLSREAAARPVRPEKRPGAGKPVKPEPGATPGPVVPARPAAGEDGYLTLSSVPWAVVTVDGKMVGSSPLFRVRLAAGRHTVSLTNEAEKLTKVIQVEIRPGEEERLKVPLR